MSSGLARCDCGWYSVEETWGAAKSEAEDHYEEPFHENVSIREGREEDLRGRVE